METKLKSSHFLHKGDVKNLLKDMKKDSVKLLITSPPYNIGKEYEKKINFEDYLDQQIEVIDELIDVGDDGSICWQVGNYIKSKGEIIPLDIPFYNIFINKGLKLRNRIVCTMATVYMRIKDLAGDTKQFCGLQN